MKATIKRWGNSNAVRIPKPLLELVALAEGDQIELSVESNSIRIHKVEPFTRHKSIKQRIIDRGETMTDYLGITEYDDSSVGDEVF